MAPSSSFMSLVSISLRVLPTKIGSGFVVGAPPIKKPLRNGFGMLHFRDSGFLQLILDCVVRDSGPLDVLPYVLDGHLDFPGNSLPSKAPTVSC